MLNLFLSVSNMLSPKKQGRLPPITNQLLLQPAHKLSKRIKDGGLTATKLCEIYTERLKEVNPFINAMAQDRFNEALKEAQRIDELLAAFRSGKPETEFTLDELEMLRSPLLGVPISVKESIMVKGMKNTCGLMDRRDVVASYDAVVVKNAQRFGLIPICTSNIPECTLYWADCQNKVYGRTLNPYNFNRISGASSGGEAALLSSAASVMGIGSDIAGSLRIPAHYCGIYSHKPSPFLVSPVGNHPELKEGRLRLFTMGPMCRYASDLRPFLKCLISDKENPKQDTYKFQPSDIGDIRKQLLLKLDESFDLSKLKIFYFNFNESQLKGKQSLKVDPEFMEAQQEILEHFQSKYNCQVQHIDLNEYLKKALFTWQCLLSGGGLVDRDTEFDGNELNRMFGIDNMFLEILKLPFGISKHTKESVLGISLGMTLPKSKEKAYPLCDKFEKFAAEMRTDIESKLGDTGVLITPTMPTVAYKHNVSLLKTPDLRFPSFYNVLQLPTTHATIRLDKKNHMPYGCSVAAKVYNDHITIAVAEEIELTFGGWTPPTIASELSSEVSKVTSKETLSNQSEANNAITSP